MTTINEGINCRDALGVVNLCTYVPLTAALESWTYKVIHMQCKVMVMTLLLSVSFNKLTNQMKLVTKILNFFIIVLMHHTMIRYIRAQDHMYPCLIR